MAGLKWGGRLGADTQPGLRRSGASKPSEQRGDSVNGLANGRSGLASAMPAFTRYSRSADTSHHRLCSNVQSKVPLAHIGPGNWS